MQPSEALLQVLAGTRTPALAEANELASHHSDWHLKSFDGYRLILVGSFDLCYYHAMELHFTEVAHIACPIWFHAPTFTDAGPIPYTGSAERNNIVSSITDPRRFVIQCDEGQHEIIARTLEIVVGTVFYYDRADLTRGERIAEWVKPDKPTE